MPSLKMFSPSQYREQVKLFRRDNPHAQMYLSERTFKVYADAFVLAWLLSLRNELQINSDIIREVQSEFHKALGIEQ
jgi:hypothetical protein